jgi:PKD repeat protein/photosystem II stability/assembly factor-like uncharacterized protein
MSMTGFTRRFMMTSMLLCCIQYSGWAQSWMQDIGAGSHKSFYDIQRQMELWEQSHPASNVHLEEEEETERPGWMQYKRWEYYMGPRVYPSGDVSLPSRTYEIYQNYLQQQSQATRGVATGYDNLSHWRDISPRVVPTGGGSGRLNFVKSNPQNRNSLWVGAAAGGLWHSSDGGNRWTTNTDMLPVIGCSDLVINPLDTQVMYLATGDGDAGDTYSIGILRSSDGGQTWDTTGLKWQVSLLTRIHRLIIDPVDTSILIAATSRGLYRTINSGKNWLQIKPGDFTDVVFRSGSASVIYAVSTRFFTSLDTGATFVSSGTGISTSGLNRLSIGVSASDSSVVYVLASSSLNTFGGLYRSANGGSSFILQSSSPNILGYNANGLDSKGQGYYTLSIVVSPTYADSLYVAGVNHWQSGNGGQTWNCISHWYGCCGLPYVHADVHHMMIDPSNSRTIYSANDGGLFKSTDAGSNWTDLSNNLQIAEIYRLGTSATSPNLVITGHQDNGTNLSDNSVWASVLGGDGMQCHIDPIDSNIMYGELYYGAISQSYQGGHNFNQISQSNGTDEDEPGAWVTPYILNPVHPDTLLMGKHRVYVYNTRNSSWAKLGPISDPNLILSLACAKSNTQYIYCATDHKIFVTKNGFTFNNITAGLPASSNNITYIAVSNTDPEHVWVTLSGYTSNSKVYKSINGGTTWINVSANLPNLPANCIVYQDNTNNGVYVGMDVGVYFMSDSFATWQPYNTDMPHVNVRELEIQYSSSKLRAATYGRGVWETDLAVPTGAFAASQTRVCLGDSVIYTSLSTDTLATYDWSLTGGSIASATGRNITVVYNTLGNYDVTLVAANANGSVTNAQPNYITVLPAATSATLAPIGDTICASTQRINLTGSPAGGTYIGKGVLGRTFLPSPALQGYDTIRYKYTSANGCSSTATRVVYVVVCTGIDDITATNLITAYPNPASSRLQLASALFTNKEISIEIYDVLGRLQQVDYTAAIHSVYLNTERLSQGVYTAQIKIGDTSYGKSFEIK